MSNHFPPFPQQFTERLTLRQLTLSDAAAIFALRSDERVNRYLDRPACSSLGEAEAFVEKINGSIAAGTSLYWAVCLRENPLLIGTICLWNFSEDGQTAELGYELSPDFQGRGIMSEAVGCVLAFAFGTLGLQTVEAYTHSENAPSEKLLRTHGFRDDADFGVPEDGHRKFILAAGQPPLRFAQSPPDLQSRLQGCTR
ncbi:MAG: GNAT family N-acetyltransferase [Saprospiraceae bacterium]|jgi:ribosomal-protein-alanine N-acetyltransferase|nr:GNAT family N-acetyltransferase [Saprospiraceae bacterium]